MNCGRILAFTILCLPSAAPLRSDNLTPLSGLILDASASSVPGAAITIVDEETGFRRTTVSQQDGGYAVSSLQPGLYKITVRKPGFRTMIRFGVKVNQAQAVRVDFRLVVGSVLESITVQGDPPLLGAEDASVGTLVSRDVEEHLPVSGRGLLSLFELAPGVIATPATHGEAGQFTVNGQRPNTNYFTVDGASANSGVSGGGQPAQSTGGSLPAMTAFGSLDDLISLEALQDLRVQTSTSVPEFGRLPGAQVSLSSRSGSNQFQGSLLYGFRNDALDANNWFANQQGDPRASLRLNDFGAALGGPVWRDRTFFFLSYEGLRLSQPFVWVEPVPSLFTRATAPAWSQPVLKLFPLPTGRSLTNGLAQWSGQLTEPSRLDVGAVRLDHAINSRTTIFGRYSNAPSSTDFPNNSLNVLQLRNQSLTLGLNLRARKNLLLDTRVNFSTAAAASYWTQTSPAASADCSLGALVSFLFPRVKTCDYLLRFSIAGVGEVVSGSEGERDQSQFQLAQTAGWNFGSHTVHFGVDYRSLAPHRRDSATSFSLIASGVGDFKNSSNLWTATSPPRFIDASLREVSLFAEDTWQITHRLTATYGLRWEISPAPVPSSAENFVDPATGIATELQRPIWNSTYANLAPRLGVAYRLNERGSTVVRAGGGYYYDSSLSLASDLVNDGPLNVSQYGSARQAPFNNWLSFGFLPSLRLPLIKQWNVSLEHAFSAYDVVSAVYAGSSGMNLIRREIGGPGSTPITLLALATNHGASSYQSMQLQYRRRLSRGVQLIASYAWSHSIDNSSADEGLYWAGPGFLSAQDRASSDFDVRHVLTTGFTAVPFSNQRGRLWRDWALDGMFRARTGFPINVLESEQFDGIGFVNIYRPDLVTGQPVWLSDPSAPGGRVINPHAFKAAPYARQGTLGRNALAGFGMSQLDLAVRREFFAGERRSIELRLEAFNALNHSNFADPIRYLSSPLFGESNAMLNLMLGTGSPGSGLAPIFQTGGARSLHVVLRFRF